MFNRFPLRAVGVSAVLFVLGSAAFAADVEIPYTEYTLANGPDRP